MLTHIHIQNLAVVEHLELDLRPGLTVLTGETGAGKSIMLDALSLALGDRADAGLIRHGKDRAEITVSFDSRHLPSVSGWLEERELDSDGECILRRTINRGGPSKAYINGQPCNAQTARELGEMLVDLHGQHEHQSLLRRATQRQLLDNFVKNSTLLEELGILFHTWQDLNREMERLSKLSGERASRIDLLRFQVNELDTLALKPGEFDELVMEQKRIANAGDLLNGCERALQRLEEGEQISIDSLLRSVASDVQHLLAADPALQEQLDLIDAAAIQLNECASGLRRYQQSLEVDPERLEIVDQRLSDIHQLSRKHQVPPNALAELCETLRSELDGLENSGVRLESLHAELEHAAREYRQCALKLRSRRQKGAKTLSEAVTKVMQQMGMQGGKFEITVAPQDDDVFSANGMDRIEFLVTANPGQPLAALTKVASGGELSRISLAIQVIAARDLSIPTLIFDEVDVGIGGGVAEIVGHRLRELANQRQVICVTHLPQVAALGNNHLQVNKEQIKNQSVTQIRTLSPDERVGEVARMLGGVEITAQTVSHAREMIERADTLTVV